MATSSQVPWRMALQPSVSSPHRVLSSRSHLSLHRQQRHAYSTTAAASTTPTKFSYHIAASFIAKGRPYDPSTHVYHFVPKIQPNFPQSSRHADRVNSGQDAFFVSNVGKSGAVAFGVADGVGGWIESGVDPSDFSHGLCKYMATAAHRSDESASRLSARQLMQNGYDAICKDRNLRAGGSTACVAIARPDGTLDVANLGDSGFLQLRLNAVHSYSDPQTHAFNTPYQLSLIPPSLAARMAAYGGAQLCDLPRDADVSEHELRHGDVLIFATDGVMDNLYNQDVLRIASRAMVSTGAWQVSDSGGVCVAEELGEFTSSPETLASTTTTTMTTTKAKTKTRTLQSTLATQLVTAAKAASVNTRVDGPFAKEVQKYYPRENWRGGKVDDICVVVAVVSEDVEGNVKSKL